MANKNTKEMIGNFIKFLDSLNMWTYNGLFFPKDADVTIDFDISELFIMKVSESSWYLILPFVIEQHKESMGIIIDLELRSHRFFNLS